MNKIPFKRFGTQLDCSRNSVVTVEALKRWIDTISAMGYNALFLYTEDTYEIEGHPYFGYGRGRYSKAELKEIDAYALSKGVELIPDINSLAHLHSLFRWKHYAKLCDCGDTLLCDNEETYEFIEAMIKTCAECFTSRAINLNMDEADMLGRGQHLDIFGYERRIDILLRHINKVSEIAKKYGFNDIFIAGDMPFRLATHSDNYSNINATVKEDISKILPEDMGVCYWDYYKRDKEDYSKLMNIHKQLTKGDVWYWGGIWTWHAFSPENRYSIEALKNSIQACIENDIPNVTVATFGDDGGECPRFSTLPATFYAAEIAKGNTDEALIKERFEEMFDIPFDTFMLLDLVNRNETEEYCRQPARYMLYNDPFIGLIDTTIPDYTKSDFEELVTLLEPHRNHPRWGYLFETAYHLCKVTTAKCDLGIRIRAAYKADDKAELKNLVADTLRTKELVHNFYIAFRNQWMTEYKGHGFNISDIRIGGVMTRLETCADRLTDYIEGRIPKIEELEEELLDIRPLNSPTYGQKKYLNYWEGSRDHQRITSTNVFIPFA